MFDLMRKERRGIVCTDGQRKACVEEREVSTSIRKRRRKKNVVNSSTAFRVLNFGAKVVHGDDLTWVERLRPSFGSGESEVQRKLLCCGPAHSKLMAVTHVF